MKFQVFCVLCLVISTSYALRQGFGTTLQEWGFVDVRPGAHLFWWFHQTSADVENYADRPVVIWLQGGPGASSTGYGNFVELGPLDLDIQPRNTSWIKDVNLLFVDNPVGTGYSYVESVSALTTTNRQIAEDFVKLLQGFYEKMPELLDTPLYIFCESYGGKMTAEIALVLDQAIKNGELNITFGGVGLGDSWISPIDSVMTWAPYLLNLGFVDQNGHDRILSAAQESKDAFDEGRYLDSTDLWGNTEYVVLSVAQNVDFYNVLKNIPSGFKKNLQQHKIVKPDEEDDRVEEIMKFYVADALGLTGSTYGLQSGLVFNALSEDFMKPVTDIVEQLLNTTDIKVAVYNGQLDLIVDTPGTVKWVDSLKFNGSERWATQFRDAVVVNGIIEGFVKKEGNLSFYWVNRAGHMVPSDNPGAMRSILRDVTDNFSKKIKKNE